MLKVSGLYPKARLSIVLWLILNTRQASVLFIAESSVARDEFVTPIVTVWFGREGIERY
ncbi:hypothetical protein [Microcoleus sp. BROC3]|uniref:hypothetical protein n=1 Tax=Microcoleus sp. BROC3 TaxID=3055323 RepID=UPI002FD53006